MPKVAAAARSDGLRALARLIVDWLPVTARTDSSALGDRHPRATARDGSEESGGDVSGKERGP